MVGKSGGHPVRFRRVAALAVRGKPEAHVVRVGRPLEILGMAGRTIGRRALISIGMAGEAFHPDVRPRQWEIGGIVVKTAVHVPRRVAGEAGRVLISIPTHPGVGIVRFRVRVAGRAGELRIVRRIGVAGGTIVPCALVRPAVYGEINAVVARKFGRRPAHIGGMTGGTVGRKIGRLVVRAIGVFKLRLVAGKTIGRGVRVIPRRMAGGTVGHIMAFFQREKTVVNHLRAPVRVVEAVAIEAVRGKPCLFVVRVRRRPELIEVAARAVVPDAAKLQCRLRTMAVKTACLRMCPDQWETVLVVDFENIVHQPIVGSVAAGTIAPGGHLVHIYMAGNTFGVRFRENQGLVAGPAINGRMLPRQFKTCLVVVEKRSVHGQGHARCLRHFWFGQIIFNPQPVFG